MGEPGAWVTGHFHCVACNAMFDGGGYAPVGCPLCGDDMIRVSSLDEVLSELGFTRADLDGMDA